MDIRFQFGIHGFHRDEGRSGGVDPDQSRIYWEQKHIPIILSTNETDVSCRTTPITSERNQEAKSKYQYKMVGCLIRAVEHLRAHWTGRKKSSKTTLQVLMKLS